MRRKAAVLSTEQRLLVRFAALALLAGGRGAVGTVGGAADGLYSADC